MRLRDDFDPVILPGLGCKLVDVDIATLGELTNDFKRSLKLLRRLGSVVRFLFQCEGLAR